MSDARKPNDLLRQARLRLPSPTRPGGRMTRQELAEAVAATIYQTTGRRVDIDARFIGRLESGAVRWPRAERRAALRKVLGVDSDAELGLYVLRVTADDRYVDAMGLEPLHSPIVAARTLPMAERKTTPSPAAFNTDRVLRVSVRGVDLAGVQVVVHVAAETAGGHQQLVLESGTQAQVYSLAAARQDRSA